MNLIVALTGTIGSLGLGTGSLIRIYGSADGTLLREEVASDEVSSLIPVSDPILESGDYHYGDIRKTKEVDVMVINAVADQIEVRVSARNFLGVEPTFPTDPNAVWTPTKTDALVTFPPVPGRVLRYRFTLKDARFASFDAFSEGVAQYKAEK